MATMQADPRREAAAPTKRLQTATAIEPLLRIQDLGRVLSCSRREVERMRAAGRLPKPDLIVGRRSPRWRPRTIEKWLDEQARGRGGAR